MILRAATIDDLPELLAFEQGVIKAERPFDPTLKPGEIHYYDLAALIESEFATLLVIVKDEQLVASGYAKIIDAKPYAIHPQCVYIGFMFVRPEYRGQGLSGSILEGLVAWSQEKKIYDLRLDVYAENEIAIKAYKKFGFNPRMIEMKLDINPAE